MESFLNRYRNITVLLLVIFAQLVLLAVQVKNDQDVRLIRVWTVTAVTPWRASSKAVRGGSIGFCCATTSPCTTPTPRTGACRPKSDRLKLENHLSQERAEHGGPRQGAAGVPVAHPLQDAGRHRHRHRARARIPRWCSWTAARLPGVERGMAVVTPGRHRGQGDCGLSHGLGSAAGHRPGFRGRRGLAEEPGARHAERTGNAPCARWTTCRSKRRWSRASGSTPPATTAFSRAAIPVGVVKSGAQRAASTRKSWWSRAACSAECRRTC